MSSKYNGASCLVGKGSKHQTLTGDLFGAEIKKHAENKQLALENFLGIPKVHLLTHPQVHMF